MSCSAATSLDGRSLTVELRSESLAIRTIGLQGQNRAPSWSPAQLAERLDGPTYQAYLPLESLLASPDVSFSLQAAGESGRPVQVTYALKNEEPSPLHTFAPHPRTGQKVRVERSATGTVLVTTDQPVRTAVADSIKVHLDNLELSVVVLPEERIATHLELARVIGDRLRIEVSRCPDSPMFVVHAGLFDDVQEAVYRASAVASGESVEVGRRTSPIRNLRAAYVYPQVAGRGANGRPLAIRAFFNGHGELRFRVAPVTDWGY